MLSQEENLVTQILMAQERGVPEKVYRKVIVGKVVVRIIDPFSGKRTELLVEGDPKVTDPAELEVSLWTPLEVKFFEKFNKGLIENGSLVVAGSKSERIINFANALSDEELKDLVTDRYFTFKKRLGEITSETTVQRLLQIAKDVNRPAKTLQTIELRLEEIQQGV